MNQTIKQPHDSVNESKHFDYDYIVIGSGFGGSVSALRLSEKGYKVLVLEKGKWLKEKDFPTTNWNLKKWLWLPLLKFFGLFKITVFRHVMVLSGAGVGGGSLVYANTLPGSPKNTATLGASKPSSLPISLASCCSASSPCSLLGAGVAPSMVRAVL